MGVKVHDALKKKKKENKKKETAIFFN